MVEHMSLQVIPCGTRVKTVIGDMPALVTGICIRENNISYELSWFYGGDAKHAWVQRIEFVVDTQVRKRAGLVNYDQPEDEPTQTLLLNPPT